jgi:hypothetical protein
MRTFKCQCGSRVFFDNFQCLACSRQLGFDPEQGSMLTLTAKSLARSRLRKCQNYASGVCNWLVDVHSATELCRSCALNREVDMEVSDPVGRQRLQALEQAKRRLLFTLNELGLPVVSKKQDAERGLAFDFKSDRTDEKVLTGHGNGLITLNLAEADPAHRERTREAMGERYRTLLGHFRHETGHYYWYLLVQDSPELAGFRSAFGDERADYADALKAHYAKKPSDSELERYISHYAASHPWEDFAETFAHYLHLLDTLQTAGAFGFVDGEFEPKSVKFEALVNEWYDLSVALNSLNRSMGLQDAYPFAIAPVVKEKLRYMHDLLRRAARAHGREQQRRWFPWRKPRSKAA